MTSTSRSERRPGPRVLVVGDVIDDIVVRPSAHVTFDSDTTSAIVRSAGGSAANQATWLGHLGVPVRFVGRVGAADVVRHRSELQRHGVEAVLVGDDTLPTGTIVVLLGDGGERTMFTDRGANAALTRADIPADALDGLELLHVNGYALFERGGREAMLGLIEAARHRGIPFTVDPCSAAFLGAAGPPDFLAWTAGAAVCFPNKDEGIALTGLSVPDDIVDALVKVYGIVALKLGAEGVLVGTGAERLRLPAVSASALDSTGAGDAFCAGFLAAWLDGAKPGDATAAGLRTAALAVGLAGGRPPLR